LLFLLDEPDPRVAFLTMKILARLLVVHGPPYVKKFADKSGGFIVLKQRLKPWWNIPSIWIICFALLFGHDVSTIDFEGEFNHFNLADLFSQKPVHVVYPEVFSIITSMLEHGLRSIVQDRGQEKPLDSHGSSPALKPQRNGSPMKPDREGGKTRNSSCKTNLLYSKNMLTIQPTTLPLSAA
jgi:beige protein homolog 1